MNMYSPYSKQQLKTVSLVSISTCIYLPLILTIVSIRNALYYVGKLSSFYVLIGLFIAETLKLFILHRSKDNHTKTRRSKGIGGYDLLKEVTFIISSVFVFFVGIILFGAPALTGHEETMMLSILLTITTIYPLARYCGVENTLQMISGVKGSSGDLEIEMFMRNLIWTVCATWLGAVVIPLDWNRPWQLWPIPCYLGALAGYFSANVITAVKCSSPFKIF